MYYWAQLIMISLERFLRTKQLHLLKKKSVLILDKQSGLGTNKLTCWHKNWPQQNQKYKMKVRLRMVTKFTPWVMRHQINCNKILFLWLICFHKNNFSNGSSSENDPVSSHEPKCSCNSVPQSHHLSNHTHLKINQGLEIYCPLCNSKIHDIKLSLFPEL